MYETLYNTSIKYPNLYALNYLGNKIKFKDLNNLIIERAYEFSHLNLNTNDIVTLCLPNIPNAVISIYAFNYIGIKVCMIHPLSTGVEIGSYMKTTKSKVLIILDILYEKIKKDLNTKNINRIILCRVSDYLDIFKKNLYNLKFRRLKTLDNKLVYWNLKVNSGSVKRVKTNKNDTCIIMFSGGTLNGKGKAICLSAKNFNSLAESLVDFLSLKVGESILAVLPLFHGFGLGVCIHTPLAQGGTAILVPKYSSKLFINCIKKYKPNYIAGIPFMIEALIQSNKKIKYKKFLKGAFVGGDKVPIKLKEEFREFMEKNNTNVYLKEGYGLTETVTVCMIEKTGYPISESMGIPIPGMEFKIVNSKGRTLPPFKAGELCISGPLVMNEYLNNKKETNKVLKQDESGKIWFHTGDIGYKDNDGNYYFKQRKKHILKISGIIVYPSIVEALIKEIEEVKDCIVTEYNGKVKALIILKNKNNIDNIKIKIKKLCKKKLNKWSVPKYIEIVNKFSTTKLGKIKRPK